MSYIGLDVGTSGCKVAVLEENGHVRVQSQRSYDLLYPAEGRVEIAPQTVWQAVRQALADVASACLDARALAVASIGEVLVLLDADDEPVANSISYLDRRCTAELQQLEVLFGSTYLRQVTGMALDQTFSLNKLLWFRAQEPEILDKARHYHLFGDYIGYLLTGARMIDPSSASRTLLFDIRTNAWSHEIADRCGVDLSRFSEIHPTGSSLGPIRPMLAEELGLPASLTVYLGSHDQCCAALGMGMLQPNQAMLGMGSSGSLNILLSEAQDQQLLQLPNICIEPYIIPGIKMLLMAQASYGTAIRWFAERYAAMLPQGSVYQQLDLNCPDKPSCAVFLPTLSGNGPCGETRFAAFAGIGLSTGPKELYRALLEGLCMDSRTNIDRLEQAGISISEICAAGGCTNSKLLLQLNADILEKPIVVSPGTQSGVTGLGMICAVAAGDCKSYVEAAALFSQEQKAIRPDLRWQTQYQKNYQLFCALQRLYA